MSENKGAGDAGREQAAAARKRLADQAGELMEKGGQRAQPPKTPNQLPNLTIDDRAAMRKSLRKKFQKVDATPGDPAR